MQLFFGFQLSKDQKEEMQRLREEAACLMSKKKSSSRVSYIQTILDSVQVIYKTQTDSLAFTCQLAYLTTALPYKFS